MFWSKDAGLTLTPPQSGYLSGPDGALQRSLVLGQVGVGLRHPGQGGAVRVEMRLLIGRVEEPALRDHNRIRLSSG